MTKRKPNCLSAAEIEVEGNYNMVGDGIINNVSKPSMLERIEEFEQRKRERHLAEMSDDRQESRKADYNNSID